jgi:hypothetical protein
LLPIIARHRGARDQSSHAMRNHGYGVIRLVRRAGASQPSVSMLARQS